MESDTVSISSKGQISIPKKVREAANLKRGDNLIIIAENNILTIKKIQEDTFKDLRKHSESVAEKIWNSPEDDIWDDL